MDARARRNLVRLAAHEKLAEAHASQARLLLRSEVRRQHERGASVRKLAATIDVGPSTVMDWLRAERREHEPV